MADFEYTYNQVNANPMAYRHLRGKISAPFIDSEEPENFNLCDEQPSDFCNDETFKILALADPIFTNPERNDFKSVLYTVVLNNTINFALEKWVISGWVTQAADLSATALGTYYSPGSLQTGFNAIKFTGYRLEWRNVLNTYGTGLYRIKSTGTFFGNSWTDCTHIYCLKQYSTDAANQTVRFEWKNNGKISYANPKTGTFKRVNYQSIDWADMIRLDGYFGHPEDQQEVVDLSYIKGNHLEIERISDKTNYNYKFYSGYYPDWVHYLLKDVAFKSNSLLVTDYNKLGKHNFIRKAVIKLPDGYTPDYTNVYQKKYNVEINFRDKLDDLGYSKNCSVQGDYCAPVIIKDQNGNIIDTKPSGSIYVAQSSGGGCDNITVVNSDDSYNQEISCEESPFVLPDINFTDTDGTVTSVPSVQNVSATLIPDLTCAQLNDADNGLTFAQRQIIQAVNTVKTGQTTSYRTGDDGDFEFGRGASFNSLTCNNPFGNTNRFTDQSGNQTYSDDIVIDWLTGLMWYRLATSGTWNNAIDGANASTQGSYSDWFLPNINQLICVTSSEVSFWMNFFPFNITVSTTGTTLWSSTTRKLDTTQAQILSISGQLSTVVKTGSRSYIYCRYFTLAELGL